MENKTFPKDATSLVALLPKELSPEVRGDINGLHIIELVIGRYNHLRDIFVGENTIQVAAEFENGVPVKYIKLQAINKLEGAHGFVFGPDAIKDFTYVDNYIASLIDILYGKGTDEAISEIINDPELPPQQPAVEQPVEVQPEQPVAQPVPEPVANPDGSVTTTDPAAGTTTTENPDGSTMTVQRANITVTK